MRNESRIFNLLAGSLLFGAGVYAWWTDKAQSGVEWVGTLALILSGTLCAMCGLYFAFIARRIEPRPEDRLDGEIADGAGEVGFFSPGSYWPFGIAVGTAVAGIGLAYGQVWLVAVGLIACLLTVCGLSFEYYTGTRRGSI
jgi:predicted ribosomally synthesized peptide with SipW-like signal peptide